MFTKRSIYYKILLDIYIKKKYIHVIRINFNFHYYYYNNYYLFSILTKDKESFDLWITHLKNIRRETLKSLDNEKYHLDIQIYRENPLQGMGLLVQKTNMPNQDGVSFMTSISKSNSVTSIKVKPF